MITLDDLIARWNTDEGKPYKGSLIDADAFYDDPTDIGCMCAQGQVLHVIGGWTPYKLRSTKQSEADVATAKVLNISETHAILLRKINDQLDGAPAVVLTDPGKLLGDQWSKLLDFWSYLDGLTPEQLENARTVARDAAWYAAWDAAGVAARSAAWDVVGHVAVAAARYTAEDASPSAAWASNEIQGAEVLRKNGKGFFFLPHFGLSAPADIPARPADYGIPRTTP